MVATLKDAHSSCGDGLSLFQSFSNFSYKVKGPFQTLVSKGFPSRHDFIIRKILNPYNLRSVGIIGKISK
jgi:hypothetical protein